MPVFTTPGTARATIEVPVGNITVIATDREDTIVTVVPTDPSSTGSVRAARDIQVRQEGGSIVVTYPESWKQYLSPFTAGTADVTVELPTGSTVRGKGLSFRADGDLAEIDMSVTAGSVSIGLVDRLSLKVAAGSISIGEVRQSVDVVVASGSLRGGRLLGSGSLKSTNGTISVDEVEGDFSMKGANGDVTLGRATGDVSLTSAHGQLRIGSLCSGAATLKTSFGGIEVGVPEGTAALLDTSTSHGRLRHELQDAAGPQDGDATVEIHASTGFGDVTIRRS